MRPDAPPGACAPSSTWAICCETPCSLHGCLSSCAFCVHFKSRPACENDMDVRLAIVTAAGEQSTVNVVADKRAVIADGSPKRARGGKKSRVITATPVRLPSKGLVLYTPPDTYGPAHTS